MTAARRRHRPCWILSHRGFRKNQRWHSINISVFIYRTQNILQDRAIIWQMTGNTSLRWDKVEQSVSDSTKPRKWTHFRFVREERPWTAMTASFACRFELASSYFTEATNFLSKRDPFLQPWKTRNLRTPALSLKKIEDKRETRRP